MKRASGILLPVFSLSSNYGILPYAAKRAMKICFGKKTPEEKESIRKHKEYKKAKKASKKETQNA